MGCDIHCNLEVREVRSDGTKANWWPQACNVLHFRWYAFFEAMAGVRGDDRNAVAPPRGLPKDVQAWPECASGAVLINEDHHSASWLTWSEFRAACAMVTMDETKWPIDVRGLLMLMAFYERNNYETRIVFNFDN